MALVNCPECGREKVSDQAEHCPDCGYGIKAHYDEIKLQEQEEEEYNIKLKSVSKPQKPKRLDDDEYKLTVFGGIVTLLCGLILVICSLTESKDTELFVIMFILSLVVFLSFLYNSESKYRDKLNKYNLAMTDFEAYQKEMVQEQEKQERIQQRREAAKLICPRCGSSNITSGTRGFTVTTGFIGSGNYRNVCQKCGFKWKPDGWKEIINRDLHGNN